jgi:GNAT superfamily N-acetyltransferase
MDFSPYQLIDYSPAWHDQTIAFLDQGYKFVGYTSLELDTLDDDLLKIEEVYSQPSCFKLLVQDEKIIGSVAVKIEVNEAELKRVFVDPQLHGEGLGKKLSLWAFDYAKEQGCDTMHIWSGTLCKTAHELYKYLGATNTQEQRFIGGQDDCYEYYFVKKL